MGELTIHELVWGYIGAVAVLAGFFTYAIRHHWGCRILTWIRVLKRHSSMEKHVKVKKMLAELRVETRADRAHIVQFHNGDYYDNQSSIKRFTYCYEDYKNGVSGTISQYQGCLVSGYVDGLEVLCDDDNPVNKLRFDALDSCLYKSRMIDDGVHLHVGVPLHGPVKGIRRIIGFILLSYNSDRAATRCSFDALLREGHDLDTDTQIMSSRECTGKCPDCRFQRYVPMMERELAKEE